MSLPVFENQKLTRTPVSGSNAHPYDDPALDDIHGTANQVSITDFDHVAYAPAAPLIAVDPNADLKAQIAALKAAKEREALTAELANLNASTPASAETTDTSDAERAALEAELAGLEDGKQAYQKDGE